MNEDIEMLTKSISAQAVKVSLDLSEFEAELARLRRIEEAARALFDGFYGPLVTYKGGHRGMTQLDHGYEEYEARMDLRAALGEELPAVHKVSAYAGPIAREDVDDFYGGVAPEGRPVL